MEHRRSRAGRKPTRGIDKPTAGDSSAVDVLSLPNIAELAMLKRREGETLAQLLVRLDLAIGNALTDDIFTDEINPLTEQEYSHSHKRIVSTKKNVDTTSSRR